MGIKWLSVVKTEASVLFQWYVFEGHKQKYFKSSLNLDFGLRNQKIVSGEISVDSDEFNVLQRLLNVKIEHDKSFLSSFIKKCYFHANSLLKVSQRIGVLDDLSVLENREILKLLLRYQDSVLSLMPFLNTILVVDRILRKEFVAKLETIGIKEKNEQDLLLSKLIIPDRKSFFIQETETLYKIALKLQKNREICIDGDIKNYLNKFAWMSSVAYLNEFQTKKIVKEKIQRLIEEDLYKSELLVERTRREAKRRYKEAFSQIKISRDLIALTRLAQEFLYLQTYRLDVFSLAHFNVYPLFQEIGRRFNLTAKDIVYLTGEEIVNLLKNERISREEIEKRRKNYALILENNQFSIISGDDVQKVSTRSRGVVEVGGTIANRGRAKGVAKLIFGVKDMKKVNRGDIIISLMTRPELVPVMIKSSGIVTDFGGILCHAAIVSREFGIPCIVGTRHATSVFKDGDIIELNAYDGIVRKV